MGDYVHEGFFLTSERTRRVSTNHGPSQEKGKVSGLWEHEENEYVYVRYGQLSTTGVARKCGAITLGVKVERLICAFASR